MRTPFIVLVLMTALAATCCTGSEDTAALNEATTEATTIETTSTTEPASTTESTVERSTPNYVGSRRESRLRVDPPVVPAEVGTTEVIVHGSRLIEDHGMFLLACPNASLDQPTMPWRPNDCGGLPTVDGSIYGSIDVKRAGAQGRFVSLTTQRDGTFTAPLTVNIDQTAIDAGGLVIRTGCMMAPSTESAILRIE